MAYLVNLWQIGSLCLRVISRSTFLIKSKKKIQRRLITRNGTLVQFACVNCIQNHSNLRVSNKCNKKTRHYSWPPNNPCNFKNTKRAFFKLWNSLTALENHIYSTKSASKAILLHWIRNITNVLFVRNNMELGLVKCHQVQWLGQLIQTLNCLVMKISTTA